MSYFNRALNDLRDETISEIVSFLTPLSDTFDAIAFRGLSGAVVAPIIAYEMDKKLIPVRKPKTDEDNHSGATVEAPPFGEGERKRILIIDDFIASGKTVATIVKLISDWDRQAEVIGVWEYCRMDPMWNNNQNPQIKKIEDRLHPDYWKNM